MESLVAIIIGGFLATAAYGFIAIGALHYLVDVCKIPFWVLFVGLFVGCWLLGVIIRAIWGKDATK